ncbi:MAG TPA: protein kinase [Polyangiaceae bacterium]|jgi:serine/threonine-protein kinase
MPEPKDPLVERAHERVGITLKEKWTLDALIGVGGMAAVYAATHRNGMRVAVKILHSELSLNAEVRTRFLREGYVANRVEHPGAVAVLDDESAEDGSVFLVMELLEGETLAHRFDRHARSLIASQILLIADQVLDVLASAHEKQIVHRDIKPDNIFLTRSGGVKLLDFGIARLRELSTQSSATRSGSTMGTPAYMAPEQARARWDEVDGRTDLWAVGATMFKLLTGRVVHVAETLNEQLLAAMTVPAPPIASLVPTAPIPVVEIVDKALAFDRNDRWLDARQMQEAVRNAYRAVTGSPISQSRLSFADDSGPDVSQAATVAVASKVPTSLSVARDSASFRSRRPGRRVSVLGALVLLGAIAAGAYLTLGQPRRQLGALLSAEPPRDSPDIASSAAAAASAGTGPGTLVAGEATAQPTADLAASGAPATSGVPEVEGVAAASASAPLPTTAEAVPEPPSGAPPSGSVGGASPPAETPAAAWLAAPAMGAAPLVSALGPSGQLPSKPTAAGKPSTTVRKPAPPPPSKKHVTRHHR